MKTFLHLFINIILLFILFILSPDKKSVLNPQLLATYSIVFIVSLFLHFINYNRFSTDKNWFRIDVFFLLGFTIVHFQWPIMYSISNILPTMPSRMWGDDFYVNYSTWLSSLGGVFWIIGFSLLKVKTSGVKIVRSFKYKSLLNITFVLFFLFLITVGEDYLTGGVYKGTGGSHNPEGVAGTIQGLFSINIILLTGVIIIQNKNNYKNNLFTWFFKLDVKFIVLFFSYILLFLSIGDRGGPISLVVATTILIGSIIRPLKLPLLLTSIFVGGALLSIISLGRSRETGLGIISAGAERFELSSGYDATLELANSFRTLNTAIKEVPQNHDFFYGKLWSSNVFAIIPYSQSIYLSLTKDKKYELSSPGYITYITHGPDAPYGEGTSVIGDIYLNFGVSGVIIIMFFAGIIFKKAEINLKTYESLKWIVIAFFLSSTSFYFGRASFSLILRPIIWGVFIISLFVKTGVVKQALSSTNANSNWS